MRCDTPVDAVVGLGLPVGQERAILGGTLEKLLRVGSVD
jgi:hypothetical protein